MEVAGRRQWVSNTDLQHVQYVRKMIANNQPTLQSIPSPTFLSYAQSYAQSLQARFKWTLQQTNDYATRLCQIHASLEAEEEDDESE